MISIKKVVEKLSTRKVGFITTFVSKEFITATSEDTFTPDYNGVAYFGFQLSASANARASVSLNGSTFFEISIGGTTSALCVPVYFKAGDVVSYSVSSNKESYVTWYRIG